MRSRKKERKEITVDSNKKGRKKKKGGRREEKERISENTNDTMMIDRHSQADWPTEVGMNQ